MFFKRNIWAIFYTVLFASILLLIAATYAKSVSLKKALQIKYTDEAKLLSENFNSALTQNELLLDVLGNRLLENQLYRNKQKTHLLLRQLLSIKPDLIAFGLTDPKGNFLAVSSNMNNIAKLPNLLQLRGTKDSFKRTLHTRRLVISRVIYFAPLKSWVIPLRKAIRDKTGKVVAVMNAGIRLQNNTFLKLNRLTGESTSVFINSRTKYRLYTTNAKPNQYRQLYSQPVAPKIVKHALAILQKKYGYTPEELYRLTKSKTFFTKGYSEILKTQIYEVGLFDPRYKIWTFLMQPTQVVEHKIFSAFWQYLSALIVFNLITFWLVSLINNTDKRNRDHLRHQANHDSLTGLYNRNFLQGNLSSRLNQNAMTVLFIDLDNFKTINDNFGHAVGDQILCQVAKRLKAFVEPHDLVVRFGGDEFLLLSSGHQNALKYAQQIITTLSSPYLIDEMTFTLGACIGISETNTADNLSLDTLISQADMAMYSAKEIKNSVAYYSESLFQKNARKMHIEQQLRNALERNEINVVYQPQMHQAGHLHGVETLARWESPVLGAVPPSEFIPIAEEIGMMPALGLFITKTAIKEICALQQAYDLQFKLSINISVKQLLSDDFIAEFKHNLSLCTMDPINLTLEVTESVFIEDIDRLLPVLNSLKALGVSLSIDDFGTGYSSLSLLRFLPLDELKIDKSFIDHLHTNEADQKLVKTIINIGQQMNAQLLAEGVERLEQLDALKHFGCTLFQGYYFSKPLCLEDLKTFLKQKTELI